MLRADDLTKYYGQVSALRGASLSVEAGQIVAVLGRNGAGKTTMLSIVAGLLKPDSGSVRVGDLDALAQPERAAKLLGIAPQETGVYPVLSVRQNLEFFGELVGLDRTRRRAAASEVAEKLGLTHLLARKASQLSGGEKRRLHTACALVHAPRLLMLDEPTVGADVATRLQIIEAVKALAREGAGVVYTTHYLPEVEALGADLVIIDDGRVLAEGPQTELVRRHELQGVRFSLSGPVPTAVAALGELSEVTADTYRLIGPVDMAGLLDRFGAERDRLISVESLKPDLETVFLAVTGSRLGDAPSDRDEVVSDGPDAAERTQP